MTYAVYVLDNGQYKPISYGDSELECIIWLESHRYFKEFYKTYIGLVTQVNI